MLRSQGVHVYTVCIKEVTKESFKLSVDTRSTHILLSLAVIPSPHGRHYRFLKCDKQNIKTVGAIKYLSGVGLNVFLFQKDSPSKPSVAELAGRFKGHILPMPTSNDEVLYLCLTCYNIPTKIPV